MNDYRLSQADLEELKCAHREAKRHSTPKVVLDNAGYYKTTAVKQGAKQPGITLVFLPPYSPNLNLIERLWHSMKQQVLYNHYYPTFNAMKMHGFDCLKKLRYRKKTLQSLLAENFEIFPDALSQS